MDTDITALAEPLVTAVRIALSELAADLVVVQAIERRPGPQTLGALNAAIEFSAGLEATMILSFSLNTALALARQIMKDEPGEISPALAADCMGEIANIVAGQAKTILAETAPPFVFSTPRVLAAVETRAADTLVIAFGSVLGDFALQLCLRGG